MPVHARVTARVPGNSMLIKSGQQPEPVHYVCTEFFQEFESFTFTTILPYCFTIWVFTIWITRFCSQNIRSIKYHKNGVYFSLCSFPNLYAYEIIPKCFRNTVMALLVVIREETILTVCIIIQLWITLDSHWCVTVLLCSLQKAWNFYAQL